VGIDIEVCAKAKVIYGGDTEDIINQYIIICKVFDEQRKVYGMTGQTAKEVICICKGSAILKEYLINREKKVLTIMMII